jgi:hypothetical protein
MQKTLFALIAAFGLVTTAVPARAADDHPGAPDNHPGRGKDKDKSKSATATPASARDNDKNDDRGRDPIDHDRNDDRGGLRVGHK